MNATVLIVDDSLTVRADLEEAFAACQIAAIGCATLAEAHAVLAQQAVGLMILDVMLPDGDGIDWLRTVRQTPRGAVLPVLILSSEAQVSDRIRGMLTGSNDYVGKPYDRDRLVARAIQLLTAGGAAAETAPLVLVIDDSLTYREQVSELLRGQHYQVALAASGEEGLRALALRRPAAIVVDGVLPGIDGATVIRTLRQDPAWRTLPCILLTGAEEEGAELRALDSGADAFVRKDGDAGLLLARLAAALRNADAAGPAVPFLRGGQRILAVDDSRTFLHELAEVLGGEGYDVILAESGEQALALMAVQQVDCVLLDRMMPGLSGTDTCRRLKSDPATRDVPLIMLTAMEDRGAMIEGLATGADDYVLKSGEFDVLKARVRAQLRRKQFEDDSRRLRAERMHQELEAAGERAAQTLAESRAELLTMLAQKNRDLELAVRSLEERRCEVDEKNRQLEKASRLKSEFLSNMSHELRTPLNSIIGFSDVLKNGIAGTLGPKQQTCVNHILTSGRHLLGLINDILDLSKVEAGQMQLLLEPVDINMELRASLAIVQDGAARRDIVLTCHPEPALGQVELDARKLRQMLYNLLANAVKFSPDGGQVTLSLHRVPRAMVGDAGDGAWPHRVLPLPEGTEDAFLEVRVRDAGMGIAEQDLSELFQTFRQLDASISREHEGSGLGLALVSRLAALHGGTVGVASAPDQGSQFSFWLPVRGAVDNPPAAKGARKVLVIEDDEHAAQLLRVHLESIGFAVRSASDAASALALACQEVPDLITLDLLLPDASGWTVLEQIKHHPALAAVPVVIVSIVAEEMKACVLGAAQLLQKPVSHQRLRDAVYALGLGAERALAPTVLIIDDAVTTSRLSADLAALNYKVRCCLDGEEALAALRDRAVDLLIIGLVLPTMSGFEVIKRLRSSDAMAHLPILVLSDSAISEADRQRVSGQVHQIMDKGSFTRQQFLFEVGRALQQDTAGPGR
ncbi:response regulator [Pseudoduganella violacea]|uniref:histidine kinase n=1 Tax=Pseudoduganella violacea TaxID=1715466 RepID=A0A7W5FWE6_9BURK|nr:response regulator [Pseudoduganella violacea]MBB3121761.1 DNA-binding response OmpR family regulator [Pseudoduganella violacea]